LHHYKAQDIIYKEIYWLNSTKEAHEQQKEILRTDQKEEGRERATTSPSRFHCATLINGREVHGPSSRI